MAQASSTFTGDPNAYTLVEYARMSDSVRTQAIIKTFYDNHNVLGDIPMVTADGMEEMKVKRLTGKSLPRTDFVPTNLDPVAAKFAPEDYIEKAYLMRNFVDVDTFYVRAGKKQPVGSIQEQTPAAYAYAMKCKMNDYFINNNHVTGDTLAPIGLKARLADTTGKYGIPADCVINAGVDLSPSSSNLGYAALALANSVDNLYDNLGAERGKNVFIYTNQFGKNAWNMALKSSPSGGGFDTTKDNYDRQVDTYGDGKIVNLGRKVDQSTPVVGFENADGTPNASGNYTSLYLARMEKNYFYGWQWGTPDWKKVGVIDNQITDRMFFEYIFGWMSPNIRSIARIYNLKVR